MSNLSPRSLAEAIGVSESSLKRWVDDGLLTAHRTAGGHRRIPLNEAIRFIRQIGASVLKPEVLGLFDLAQVPPATDVERDAATLMHKALEAGEASKVRGMVQSLYLSGWSPARIFDGPLRESMTKIGELWLHADWGIVVEHRATDIVISAINQLRLLSPPRGEAAPVALGCAIDEDFHAVPSLMAAAVLGDVGYLDINLGAATPAPVLVAAMNHHKPCLVWVACSLDKHKNAAGLLEQVAIATRAANIPLVVGGRGFIEAKIAPPTGAMVVESMSHLEQIARSALPHTPSDPNSTRGTLS